MLAQGNGSIMSIGSIADVSSLGRVRGSPLSVVVLGVLVDIAAGRGPVIFDVFGDLTPAADGAHLDDSVVAPLLPIL